MPTQRELELERQHQDDLYIMGQQANTIAELRQRVSELYCQIHGQYDKPREETDVNQANQG